jgi:DNA-binding HxlR family transcriptional regulator
MTGKKFDVYQTNCPSHQLLDIIGNKWIILIIHKLSQGTMRFGELKREMNGISQKVLSQSLRTLEENGLVTRVAFDEVVLRVEYSLTPLGKSLATLCFSLTKWAEENIGEIQGFKQAAILQPYDLSVISNNPAKS